MSESITLKERLYQLLLIGYRPNEIADKLNNEGYRTKHGKLFCSKQVVNYFRRYDLPSDEEAKEIRMTALFNLNNNKQEN